MLMQQISRTDHEKICAVYCNVSGRRIPVNSFVYGMIRGAEEFGITEDGKDPTKFIGILDKSLDPDGYGLVQVYGVRQHISYGHSGILFKRMKELKEYGEKVQSFKVPVIDYGNGTIFVKAL